MYTGARYERRRPYRGRGIYLKNGPKIGGYRFFDSGDGQGGVWTEEMRAAEEARRRAQQ